MKCPECKSNLINQNGCKRGKQKYICKQCGRQFIEKAEINYGYAPEIKQECLTMYMNGNGFRTIARVKDMHHTTIINWVKQVGELLPDTYHPDQIPQVGELDELQTFVGSKK
jgi:transposase-like protein